MEGLKNIRIKLSLDMECEATDIFHSDSYISLNYGAYHRAEGA